MELRVSNLAIYNQVLKGKILWFQSLESEFKGQISFKIQFRPASCIQIDLCNIIINGKKDE